MQLIWSKQIIDQDMWQPYYEGFFCKVHDSVHFFYKGGCDALRVIAQDKECSETVYEDKHISLPAHWILVKNVDLQYLFFAPDAALDLSKMKVINDPPAAARSAYEAQRTSEYHYVEDSFYFDEYCVSHKGNWGYICTKNAQKIWEFTGHAYLYTDFIRWNDRLYFGTAGQGGYFYVLDLETGEALTKIKTGGTTSIVQDGNQCYILRNDKNAKLVCVDLTDGVVKEEIDLPAKASGYNSKLCLIDGNIHAITFEMKKDILRSVYWSSVAI